MFRKKTVSSVLSSFTKQAEISRSSAIQQEASASELHWDAYAKRDEAKRAKRLAGKISEFIS